MLIHPSGIAKGLEIGSEGKFFQISRGENRPSHGAEKVRFPGQELQAGHGGWRNDLSVSLIKGRGMGDDRPLSQLWVLGCIPWRGKGHIGPRLDCFLQTFRQVDSLAEIPDGVEVDPVLFCLMNPGVPCLI